MAFSLLDPKIKQLEKIIRQEEQDKVLNKLTNELHKMKTPGVTCFCDKCDVVRDLITKVTK